MSDWNQRLLTWAGDYDGMAPGTIIEESEKQFRRMFIKSSDGTWLELSGRQFDTFSLAGNEHVVLYDPVEDNDG